MVRWSFFTELGMDFFVLLLYGFGGIESILLLLDELVDRRKLVVIGRKLSSNTRVAVVCGLCQSLCSRVCLL